MSRPCDIRVLADDLAAAYQWSKGLKAFHGDLETDAGGTTVAFTIQAETPAPGTTTVTAKVTGTACDRLFLRAAVTENRVRPAGLEKVVSEKNLRNPLTELISAVFTIDC